MRILRGIVTVAAAAAVGIPAGAAAAVPSEPSAASRSATHQNATGQAAGKQITLITGDRVTLRSDGGTSVQTGPGRAGMRFITQKTRRGQTVIPADALPLLRAGRLDKRLFDVGSLVKDGYTASLPLLVSYRKNSRQAAPGVSVTRELPVIKGRAVRADEQGRSALWQSLTNATADKIWLDGKRKVSLDKSVPQIGAPAAWAAGFDGTGVKVAVLDTGIDATHPDLAGQIAESQNFTGTASTDDVVGHGTHVASTIAGTGAASGGRYRGVAPGAKLVIGKVCGTEFCDDSAILAGMAWAAQRASVVNLSLGGMDSEGIDPLEAAVNELTAQYGTLFVIAAGNDGTFAPVSSPATADAALAVGAVDREDQLAEFSSRGPRVGDNAIKPEITAPGVEIVAAKAAHDVIGDPAPLPGYSTLSGTSMATPHVAGAAAILAQEHPGWTARQRKTVLMGAAKPTEGLDVYSQGAGRVDVARAINQQVAVDEGTLSFEGGLWPHGDDQPETKTVTYRNNGPEAVTLTLSLSAPAAVFSVAATTLTVPANGTATTTVTSDTSANVADGHLGGYLTATGPGGLKVETPVAVVREPESYDISFEAVNRDGSPATDGFASLVNLATGESIDLSGLTGKQRVPKAEYGIFATVFGQQNEATQLIDPQVVLDSARTIRFDARVAKPISVTVPTAGAASTFLAVDGGWVGDNFSYVSGLISDGPAGIYTAQIGDRAGSPLFSSGLSVQFAQRNAENQFRNSPYVYDLGWFFDRTMFTGLQKSVRARNLATIRARYNTEASGALGAKANSARHGDSGYWSSFIPFDLPFQRTEYVNTDGGAQFSSEFQQNGEPDEDGWPTVLSVSYEAPATFRARRTYRQTWNKAVFAPSVADVQEPYGFGFRQGDELFFGVATHGEGPGREGYSTLDKAHVALYRNGTLVGEQDAEGGSFTVPAEAAGYRVELSASRGAPHTLSTEVSGTWTFRSGHTGEEKPTLLTLSTVRFDPALDEHNAARAGRSLTVPVHVDQQGGAARIRSVRAEVSFDDGATWTRVPVRGSGADRSVVIRHPAKAGFVSLRATAGTAAGSVTETAIRAYAIK